jgi:hypothetical protein
MKDTHFCQWKGVPTMCGPRGLPGDTNILYHNNGDGTFTDVSQKAGILKPGPAVLHHFGELMTSITMAGRTSMSRLTPSPAILSAEQSQRHLQR